MKNYKEWLRTLSDEEYQEVMEKTKHMWNQSYQTRLKRYFELYVCDQKTLETF